MIEARALNYPRKWKCRPLQAERVLIIMPKAATSPKPAQPQDGQRESETRPVVRQAPPPPGMGKIVDKTA
jgi:hypothetical protein